jgi:hypothetical protein
MDLGGGEGLCDETWVILTLDRLQWWSLLLAEMSIRVVLLVS